MEFIEGIPVDDLARIERYGFDPAPVVSQTVKGFLLTTIRWGFFHGDVHAGNLLLRPDGQARRHRLGHHRPPRSRHAPVLPPDRRGRARRRGRRGRRSPSTRSAPTARVLEEGLGMTEEDLTLFMKATLEPLLRSPFGEVSLVDILNAPQQKVAEARGIQAERLTVRGILRAVPRAA